jgi:hypothetical protein
MELHPASWRKPHSPVWTPSAFGFVTIFTRWVRENTNILQKASTAMSDQSEVLGQVRDTASDKPTPSQLRASLETYRRECRILRGHVDTLQNQGRLNHETIRLAQVALRELPHPATDGQVAARLVCQAVVDASKKPAPVNVREGHPYTDPRFESLCRDHGIWGTPESALAAVFWKSAIQA